jgi:hypothetical protein
MAESQPTSISMELAEFFAKIVLDASDGIREALRLQEERHAEMSAVASLDTAEFARLAIREEEVERELGLLFPGTDPHRPHGVFVGAPYHPALNKDEAESPPFRQLIGIQLERSDYTKPRGLESFVLAKKAVEKIRFAVRTRLGFESQRILRRVLNRGVPCLVVDSGRVSAKISLILLAKGQPSTPIPVRVPRKDAMLLVRMVDDQAPQNLQLRVDILSELEVKFKALT